MASSAVKDPGFISDEEMARLEKEGKVTTQPPGFISDEEMARMEAESKPKSLYESLKASARPYIEELPAYGGLIGGTVGGVVATPETLGAAMLPGAMLGSSAGAYLGSAAKNAILRHVYDEPISDMQTLKEPLQEAALGAAGEGMGAVASKGMGLVGRGLMKASSELSGIPERAAETYLKNPSKIDKLTKEFGGDTFEATEDMRRKASTWIRNFKNTQNAKIERTLRDSSATVDLTDAITDMEGAIKKLHPIKDAEARKELSDLIFKFANITKDTGFEKVPVADAQVIKEMFQEATDYGVRDSALARNSKANAGLTKIASRVRSRIDTAVPEVAQANKQLSQLHNASRKMNKNLVNPGGSEAAVIAAGAGKNLKSQADLKRISGIIGNDVTSEADDIAAMNYLGNASILPKERTGFVAPLMTGLGAGAYALQSGDLEGAAKFAATSALASPVALKQALRLKALQRGLLPNISEIPLRALGQAGSRGLLSD